MPTPRRSRRPHLSDSEKRILQALRRIIRSVDIYSRKLASGHAVTGPQLICLLSLVEEGPTTVKDLGARVSLSPSTVVRILDRLEHKGLVDRSRDAKDRRLVNVSATREGRVLVRNAPSPLQDRFVEELRRLPELEQIAIALSLERIVDLMSAEDLDAAPILETGTIPRDDDGAANGRNPK